MTVSMNPSRVFFLIKTTAPFVLGILLLNLSPFLNACFLVPLGAKDLSVLGTVNMLLFFPETIVYAISYSIQSLSAQSESEGEVYSNLFHGTLIAFILILPICYGLYITLPLLFEALIPSVRFSDVSKTALFLLLLAFFAKCIILLLRGFYASKKHNHLFFMVIAVSTVVQFLLNSLLIHGFGPVRTMGFLGLAWAELLAKLVGLLIYTFCLYTDYILCPPSLRVLQLNPRIVRRLIAQSTPLAIYGILDHYGTLILFNYAQYALTLTQVACLHLSMSVLGCFPGMGFALCSLTMISRSLSRKKSHLAKHTGNLMLLLGIGFMTLCGIVFACLLPYWIKYLLHDSQMRSALFLPLELCLLTVGLHVACQIAIKSLHAIGAPGYATTINLLGIYGFRIPAIILLCQIPKTTLTHFVLILIIEKLLRFVGMYIFWMRFFNRHLLYETNIQSRLKVT